MHNCITKHNPKLAERITEAIFDALQTQTVVVVGTGAAATIIPILTNQLKDLYTQRAHVLPQVDALVDPLFTRS